MNQNNSGALIAFLIYLGGVVYFCNTCQPCAAGIELTAGILKDVISYTYVSTFF